METYWWPIAIGVSLALLGVLGAILRWAAGAWIRMLSRAEAVAVVTAALQNCGMLEAQVQLNIKEKLDSLHEGQEKITEAMNGIDRRLVRVESGLNGTVAQWDQQTERRRT